MHLQMSRERILKRQRSRMLARCLSAVLAVVLLTTSVGCNHRKLPPELKYSPDNVDLIRKSLNMNESADEQPQKADQPNGDGSGGSSADSDDD